MSTQRPPDPPADVTPSAGDASSPRAAAPQPVAAPVGGPDTAPAEPRVVDIPELALVVLIGVSGSGKSSFARAHFAPTEVISSDTCRGWVSDDENDQTATADAFDVLHYLAGVRLKRGRLTVIDATNVQAESRRSLVKLARAHDVLPVAIVLDMPSRLCKTRNAARPDRQFGPHVVAQQHAQLRRGLRGLKREGFRRVIRLESPEQVAAVRIERRRLWNDKRDLTGPFDLIGDIHGCRDELEALLDALGWQRISGPNGPTARHPDGRTLVFLGDLVDRGPDSPGVLRWVMNLVADGVALCVPGNHEVKLKKWLDGRRVKLSHGLAETVEQLADTPDTEKAAIGEFIQARVSHYVLDGGKLVVSHAGLTESLQGRASSRVRQFALYGETTGETDEFGLPVRHDWAKSYRGRAMVVYGHTPVPEAVWVNNTICLDTGCVFGGALTALRYPERELVQVPAAREYYAPVRPLVVAPVVEQREGPVLDYADVAGRQVVETRFGRSITLPADHTAAALEVMSRFALDPRWLIYLPPTMSPSATSKRPGLLEHPDEAFGYFQQQRVPAVICQEKHMGSRAVVIVARTPAAAAARFGVPEGPRGVVYTRTGRSFFRDAALEAALLDRLAEAVSRAGLWDALDTDWLCLDAELMPWSLKAESLLRTQYAAVGAAARAGLGAAVAALQANAARSDDPQAQALLDRFTTRRSHVDRYVAAYRAYCWQAAGVDDLALAPFHILAAEGRTFFDRDHRWHMEALATLCGADPGVLRATPYRVVELADEAAVAGAVAWWEARTAAGGEGMVVKPLDWLARKGSRLVQPALKCRGRDYLRIIYGPEYTEPEHLERLRSRGLKRKRSLAEREFLLGLEGLARFAAGEPLYRVHQCVFGVMALEAEPVDPRL